MEKEKYIVNCPHCNHPNEITRSEIEWGSIMCSNCDEFIEINNSAAQNGANQAETEYGGHTPSNNFIPRPTPPETVTEERSMIKEFDIALNIESIKRMGLISIVCAVLCPIATLICAVIGKKRGEKIRGVPRELMDSLDEAIKYNKIGRTISAILIVAEVIPAFVCTIVLIANLT